MKYLLIIAALTLSTAISFAAEKKVVKKTTHSSEYVPAGSEATDTTVIDKKTKVNPGTVNADGSVTAPTQTTTTKKTRKY